MSAQRYVVGFMFDVIRQRVVLIRKQKPVWQAGKLNGVGGKVEPGEEPREAMVREFREETGVRTEEDQWKHFCSMTGACSTETSQWRVEAYTAVGSLAGVRSMEAEKIEIVDVQAISLDQPDMISNLPWLMALALDRLRDAILIAAVVDYR